ncbi:MAG: hypothetical protein NC485_13895 [Ruminococcus flavefaciens]|nr:hypothetical protein [Ruminococcus flavefaciens]MCM1062577.1 hypothetical protein [Eubacterium sp.]
MNAKLKALEITAELVKARLNNSEIRLSTEGGQATAAYFEAIYNKVSEITKEIAKGD